MLTRILEWSLHNRVLVVAGWIAIAVAGGASLLELPLDAFPDTTPVQVQANAVAPALGPLEIERRITIPMERIVGGLPHLENVRSVSKFGFAQLTLTFEDGTDIWLARQVVAERMQTLDLDALEERPTLGPVATGLGEVFHYVVRSESRTTAELRTLQEWLIAPQLRAVPGVAEVNSWAATSVGSRSSSIRSSSPATSSACATWPRRSRPTRRWSVAATSSPAARRRSSAAPRSSSDRSRSKR